jgi:hypothetical protein
VHAFVLVLPSFSSSGKMKARQSEFQLRKLSWSTWIFIKRFSFCLMGTDKVKQRVPWDLVKEICMYGYH